MMAQQSWNEIFREEIRKFNILLELGAKTSIIDANGCTARKNKGLTSLNYDYYDFSKEHYPLRLPDYFIKSPPIDCKWLYLEARHPWADLAALMQSELDELEGGEGGVY